MEDDDGKNSGAAIPDSLLPYDRWTQEALRHVVLRALAHVAENGLPGDHHFYITFRTDHPGVSIPARLREKYPREITIVLQHQFSGLKVDEAASTFSVRLSFGGVPADLLVPIGAVTMFHDRHVQFGLTFEAEIPEPPPAALPPPAAEGAAPQVVSLDAFRKRRD